MKRPTGHRAPLNALLPTKSRITLHRTQMGQIPGLAERFISSIFITDLRPREEAAHNRWSIGSRLIRHCRCPGQFLYGKISEPLNRIKPRFGR